MEDTRVFDDAYHYAFGAAAAIGTERQKPEFQNMLNNLIGIAQRDAKVLRLSFDELADLTVDLTKQRVRGDGDSEADKNSVGWHMGIICYVWNNSLPIAKTKFTEIFMQSWKLYFGQSLLEPVIDLLHLSFDSTDHIRYQNGKSTSGHNYNENRRIVVEKNWVDGDYLTTIYNMSGVHPVWQDNVQMATKRMRVIKADNDETMLRGYGVDPMGNSFADYGITIKHPNSSVDRIILHMYDRFIDIEYFR